MSAEGTKVLVCVTVDSSRYAELSWTSPDGAVRLVLPPCTNLALNLRVPATENTSLSLSPAPGATGLWRAGVRAEWRPWSGVDREGTRVKVGDGAFVDIEGSPAVFAGILPGTFTPGEPTRGKGPRRQGGVQNNPSITFQPRLAGPIIATLGCLKHGPDPHFEVAFWNGRPPYRWEVNENVFETLIPELSVADGLAAAPIMDVRCTAVDQFRDLTLTARGLFGVGSCPDEAATNIVGACWGSTHDPTDATDHLPGVVTEISQFGPNCPVYTNCWITAGWTHDTAILWIRNLVRILTGDPWDDETDHCIAYDWRSDLQIPLAAFLPAEILPFLDKLEFRVDGAPSPLTLTPSAEPSPFHPRAFHAELVRKSDGATLDRMWIVVNNSDNQDSFRQWFLDNADTSWVATLPRPHATIRRGWSVSGEAIVGDPEPGAPNQWTEPSPTSGSYLHHDAKWEMRAYGNTEGHGNQACYDANGDLIRSGIAGGTADFSPGFAETVLSHIEKDVNPFLHAVRLDGNPGDLTGMNDLLRPCLHQGVHIDQYISRRPIVQPEETP